MCVGCLWDLIAIGNKWRTACGGDGILLCAAGWMSRWWAGREWKALVLPDRQTDRQTDCRAPTGGGPADDISFSFLGFFRTLTMISAPPPDVLAELGSSPLSPTTATATTTLHASSHTAQYSSKIPERAGHARLAGPVYHTEKRNGSKYKIF
jgi:hypothetical protein